MSPLEIIGGILIIICAILLIIVITLQESKSGLTAFTGVNESYSKNRGKTMDAMLSRATKVVGVAFVVLTLAVNIAAIFAK